MIAFPSASVGAVRPTFSEKGFVRGLMLPQLRTRNTNALGQMQTRRLRRRECGVLPSRRLRQRKATVYQKTSALNVCDRIQLPFFNIYISIHYNYITSPAKIKYIN